MSVCVDVLIEILESWKYKKQNKKKQLLEAPPPSVRMLCATFSICSGALSNRRRQPLFTFTGPYGCTPFTLCHFYFIFLSFVRQTDNCANKINKNQKICVSSVIGESVSLWPSDTIQESSLTLFLRVLSR